MTRKLKSFNKKFLYLSGPQGFIYAFHTQEACQFRYLRDDRVSN